MAEKKILALSSSRVGNSGYLEKAVPLIKDFLGDQPLKIAFIPFASVDSHEEYFLNVSSALKELPYDIIQVNHGKIEEVENADVIMIGGGNTFKLLHDLFSDGLLNIIRQKVNSGTPYIGWSAGSNILSPTLCTTNDMPVIEPESFKALGIFKFQINPHYYNQKIEGFNGETRDQRLHEFMKVNPGVSVIGLPEGTALQQQQNNVLKFLGLSGILFHSKGNEINKVEISEGDDLSYLL